MSGWMSWICRTCLLYSSFIVLISVRQDITLGYSRLQAEETKEGESEKDLKGSGPRVALCITLTVSLVLSSCSQSRTLESAPSSHEARQSHGAAAHLDGLIK